MALKVTARALAKGMVGAILGYILYNLNQPILEALLSTDLSVTWISFLLGLYNVASMGGIIVVNGTLGSITPDMVEDAKKTGEEINKIADRKIEQSEVTKGVIEADKNMEDHGTIYEKEEVPIEEIKVEEPTPEPIIVPEPTPIDPVVSEPPPPVPEPAPTP